MRKIAFRAWNEVLKEWVAQNAVHVNGVGILGFIDGVNGRFHEAAPHYKFSQFTGLFDKSGKEIWEGDVLGSGFQSCIKGHVVFDQGMFMVSQIRPYKGNTYFNHPEAYEVLGNIYENPELIGENGK